MGNVGLLFVGAVLFVNGSMLLGWVKGTSAAPMNIFVGILQVVTPTYLIFTAHGNEDTILMAAGLYLFGFTYLYVAFNLLMDLDGTGCGYFCLFVVLAALVFADLNFFRFNDATFGVIWLLWAFLWALFFLVLGLGRTELSRYTGAVCAIEGWITGFIPGMLLLTGHWGTHQTATSIGLAIFAVVVFGGLYPVMMRGRTEPLATQAPAAEPVATT